MSDVPADSPVESAGQSWLAGPQPPREGWSRKKFFFVLFFVLAFHVALIVLFGARKQITARAVSNLPHAALADSANEFIALGDPTLFARPNKHDVVTAFWRREPPVSQPNFDWQAPSGYLQPKAENFGAVFRNYMQHKAAPGFALNLKPEPRVRSPEVEFSAVPLDSLMQISGDLARRPLLTSAVPPSIPYNDVLDHSVIHAVVDTAGNVATAVVMSSSGYNDADQRALQITRNLSFAPAPNLTVGEITFIWRTVPTNAVPAKAP